MNPYVTITPLVGSAKPMRFLLGASPAVPAADGGWAIVTRPKNSGFTAWEGYGPYQMTLNVVLDGLKSEKSQEKTFQDLRNIMRVPTGVSREPSPVKLSGPVPLIGLHWVINSLEQDPASIIRSNASGELLRVSVNISLIQYVEADVVIAGLNSPAGKINLTNSSKAPTVTGSISPNVGWFGKTYVTKAGDTLASIAQSELGSYTRFAEIGDLNKIRDLKTVPVGTVLKIPRD